MNVLMVRAKVKEDSSGLRTAPGRRWIPGTHE